MRTGCSSVHSGSQSLINLRNDDLRPEVASQSYSSSENLMQACLGLTLLLIEAVDRDPWLVMSNPSQSDHSEIQDLEAEAASGGCRCYLDW